jgi:hypothetical protein
LSIKQASKHTGLVELNTNNIDLLNGKYQENPVRPDTTRITTLSWEIFDHGYNVDKSKGYIEFKVINCNNILVSIHDSDSIVKSRVFQGEIKDGYFQFNRKYLIIPMIFVNLFRNRIIRVGILDNNNLITDYAQLSFGTLYVIIPFLNKNNQFDVEFKKRN